MTSPGQYSRALIAHGVISRATQDVDLFTDDEAGVGAAAERVDLAGGLAEVFEGMGEGLAECVVTAPGGEQMVLQLAYFGRAADPVPMDVGPVLDLEDVIGGKACARWRAGQSHATTSTSRRFWASTIR